FLVGGNTGLGYETAKALVEAGFITVIACRSVGKGQEAIDNIEAQTGIKGKLSVMSLDLSSLESVKAFVREFKAGHQRLDVLVNNAGMMDIPFGLTKEGFEMQFGVNHLGHYVLTLQLLPLLNKAPQGRVVVLSSGAMYSSTDIRYDLLQSSKGYSRLGHYSYSKLANMMFAKALNRRLQQAHSKVTVNACHPGACSTELFRHNAAMNLMMVLARVVCRSPLVGAMSSIYLALAPELDNVSGEYFFDQIPRTPHPIALEEKSQELLWTKSVEYTGVDFKL
ncbi:short-chain dehydrogenase/reductase SDR, partial [Dissophora ornata]